MHGGEKERDKEEKVRKTEGERDTEMHGKMERDGEVEIALSHPR